MMGLLGAWVLFAGLTTWGVRPPAALQLSQTLFFTYACALFLSLFFIQKIKTSTISQLAILGFYGNFSYAAWYSGGIESTALEWLALMPSCTILLSTSTTIFWALCSITVFAFYAWAHHAGLNATHMLSADHAVWMGLISMGITITLLSHTVFYEKLNQLQIRKLIRKNNRLLFAQQKLLKTQQHKDEFIAVVSHELRTPMNAVLGFTSLMREQLPAYSQKLIDHIQQSSRELLSIISDILDYSQLQASKVLLVKDWCDPRELLTQSIQRVQKAAQDKGLELEFSLGQEVPYRIHIDSFKISQVLDQLLVNAIKFSNRGVISLSLNYQQQQLIFQVCDQGIGIDPKDLPQIFDGFQHANAEVQHRYGGTGLGLAICKQIINLHDGDISVSSYVQKGSTFTITLHQSNQTQTHDCVESQLPPSRSFDVIQHIRPKIHAFVQDLFSDRVKIFSLFLVFTSINLVYYEMIAPSPEEKLCEAIMAVALTLTAVYLYQKGSLALGLFFTNIVCCWGILYLSLPSGGIFSTASPWVHLIPIAPFFLSGLAMQVTWFAISITIQLYMIYATATHQIRIEPDQVIQPLQWSTSGHVHLLLLLFLVPLIYKQLRKQANQELIEKNLQLLVIKKDLLHQQVIKNQFIATISHAFRTPMNAIIGFNSLLKDELQDTDTSITALHDMVTQAAQHLLTVINDILDLSQMETGKLKLKNEPFDLIRTVHTAFHMFDATYHNEQVKLVLQMDDIPSWVVGDAQRLTQIIVNLLNNAIKFTTQGSIQLLVKRCDQGLEFMVRDTGTGIAKEKLVHIFEQFEQVHSLHRKKGHGLGLSITKQLVEAQQGRIQVSSEVNEGSVFSFWLNLPTCAPVLAKSEHTHQHTTTNDSLTILIVDDQPLNRLLVKKVLEKAWPHSQLLEAEHGLQAIEAHQHHTADLILMDVLMPEMDGITATHKIRTELDSNICNVPIIGLTANAYETTKSDCLNAGMNDVIYKPFNRDDLIQRIEELTHTVQMC